MVEVISPSTAGRLMADLIAAGKDTKNQAPVYGREHLSQTEASIYRRS